MAEDTSRFVHTLLSGVPAELWTYLWTLPDKRSHWFEVGDDPEPIARAIDEFAASDELQVYISVSAAVERGTAFKRIMADTSGGIMGLWADIDILEADAHKKWNLPPTEDAAREVISATGLEPTMLVHSGHGLQAWWLFPEFWQFDTDEERTQAANLAQAWNQTIKVRAGERNWTIDSTFDLSRVMRPPGAVNRKADPVVVRLLEHNPERRWNASDFEEFLADESILRDLGIAPTREYIVGDIVLNRDAQPPFDQFNMLKDFEPKFQQSWDHKRRDLTDQTASTYDLSLASFAAASGWDDQDIANLIIAHRRHHKDDVEKAMRVDYIKRTIARARQELHREHAIETIEETAEALKVAKRSSDPEEVIVKKREVFGSISDQLNLEVVGIFKLDSTPPTWQLELAGGQRVNLGTAKDLLTWNVVRARISEVTNHLIERMSPKRWDSLVQAMMDVADVIDTGLESTEHGQMYLWLTDYISTHTPLQGNGARDEAALTDYPYINDLGQLVIFATTFKNWLWVQRNARLESRDLSRRLHDYGAVNGKENVNVETGRTTKSVWRLPLPTALD